MVVDAIIQEGLAERKRKIFELRKRHSNQHYGDLRCAKANGTKVAWTPAGVVSPLLDALGIMACSPENYSALSAAKQMAGRFCDIGESQGLSPSLCSYGLCIMGMIAENDGPLGPLPAPDLVVLDASACDAHAKMWEIPAKHFHVPAFCLDGSYSFDGQCTQRELDYRVSELHRLVRFCEENLGAKFDYDRFKADMRIEAQVRAMYAEMCNLRKEVPCPRSTRDTAADIFHILLLVHKPEALEYMTVVLEDCRERVKHKIGAVANERFRLFYDNIALWFWLPFYDYLQERGAVFASDSYTTLGANGFFTRGGQYDPERPFENLALRHMHCQVVVGLEATLEHHATLIQDWHCDGAVIFANRSCKILTAGRFDKTRLISDHCGLPIFEFEGEMANPSSIDKVDILSRADAFLEMLEARAAKGK